MTWLKRAGRRPVCACTPPMLRAPIMPHHITVPRPRPDGLYGDLWQCDNCGVVWKIGVTTVAGRWPNVRLDIAWIKANPFTQWRHRNRTRTPDHRIGAGLRATIEHAERGES